jgi:hypothetical protein
MVDKLLPYQFPDFTTGNAVTDGRVFNQWFVGDIYNWSEGREDEHFHSNFGLRDTRSVEVKWGIHKKGEQRSPGWVSGSGKLSLSILIRGRFSLRFRKPEDRDREWEHILAVEGDYVIWNEVIEHTWRAEEDSTILTIRWRDLPYPVL